MSYTVSQATKDKLEQLIDNDRGDTHGYASRGGVRQVIHVKITGPLSSGFYPCLPRAFVPDDDDWVEFDEALVFEANGRPLSEDQTYIAVRYGVGPDSKLVFATTTGSGMEFVEISGGGGGVYSGNGVSVVSGSWASNGLTYSTIYRAPSADYDEPTLPEIPPGQVVLVRPSPTEADAFEMTAWGGQRRVCDKKFLGSYCDGGNIVNVYEYNFWDARDLCKSPAPSDCGASPPPPPPPPVTYYDCDGGDCIEVPGPSDYPDDPTCGGNCGGGDGCFQCEDWVGGVVVGGSSYFSDTDVSTDPVGGPGQDGTLCAYFGEEDCPDGEHPWYCYTCLAEGYEGTGLVQGLYAIELYCPGAYTILNGPCETYEECAAGCG